MNEIGYKMYLRRKELGLTLEDVGKAVGVGKSTVRKWENGTIRNMGRDKIALVAKVLKMDPVEFVPGDGSGFTTEPEPENDEIRIIARGMHKMTEEQRKQLIELVRVAFQNYDFFKEEDDD